MSIRNIIKKIADFPFKILTFNLLVLILITAFFVRVYRINDLLGFYYDQGRDALVIWDLWHKARPFLIGPVTGLHGIFLGPLYYYLIAPFYLLGRGNPVYPSVFLSLLSVVAIFFLFVTGRSMHSRRAGLIAAIIASFAYYIVYNSRWLSNPNPIQLTSVLLLFSLWKIVLLGQNSQVNNEALRSDDRSIFSPLLRRERNPSEAKSDLAKGDKNYDRWWIFAALLVGASLQFESASGVFYIPLLFIFAFWQRKNLPGVKTLLISAVVFFATLVPQIYFNFRHDNILLNNFIKLFFHEKAFRPFTYYIVDQRIKYFWSAFSGKLYAGWNLHDLIFVAISFSALFIKRKGLNKGLMKLFLIFLLTPMFFYTLFQGNFGNIYDYYLSGYFLPFILFFSIGLAEYSKTLTGKIVLIVFFISFFQLNGMLLKGMLTNSMDSPSDIKLGSQLKAVNWMFDNAAGKGAFNEDTYVPPVIPYAYDYLILWQGTMKCGSNLCGKVDYNVPLLYVVYEQDPPHPERLENWLSKYKSNTTIEETQKYGGITVERRIRK